MMTLMPRPSPLPAGGDRGRLPHCPSSEGTPTRAGPYRWELEKGGRERQVAVTGALFENDARLTEHAVLTGEVIGFAFEAQVACHLASGALEAVLDDWCPSFPGFHLYYPSRRDVTPALRAFIDAMKGDG